MAPQSELEQLAATASVRIESGGPEFKRAAAISTESFLNRITRIVRGRCAHTLERIDGEPDS